MTDHVSVLTSKTEDLTSPVREAIIALCVAAFDEPDFLNLFTYVSSGGMHFLAYRGAELVSHAMVTTRWLQPAGLPILKTGWVDAMGTAPQFQGRGCGSAVMRCLADFVAGAYEIGGLQTERIGFYARLGWEDWRGPLAGRSQEGLVPTPTQTGVMILRLPRTPVLDLDTQLTIECQTERIW
jgi:aminoglycoside 2'-N-acetyltransferase I